MFIVGHLRETARPEVFPFSSDNFEDTKIVGKDVSYALDANYYKGTNNITDGRRQLICQLNQPVHSNDRIYSPEGIAPTLNTMQGGRRQPLIALVRNGADPNSKTDSARMRKATGLSGILDEVSDTQRYKCCGNAVTVNVIQAIMEKLLANLSYGRGKK